MEYYDWNNWVKEVTDAAAEMVIEGYDTLYVKLLRGLTLLDTATCKDITDNLIQARRREKIKTAALELVKEGMSEYDYKFIKDLITK